MLKIRNIIFILLTLFIFSTTAFANNKAPNYLFVQSSDTAVLKVVDAKKGLYTLTLNNIPPHVTYFSDRPDRTIGLMKTSAFFNLWQKNKNNSFGQVPPNVNVEGIKFHQLLNEKDVNTTVTVKNPRYDQKNNSVIYDMVVLGADKDALSKQEGTLHHVVLVFDNWCPGCCCG